MGWRRVAKLYVSISSVKSLCGRSTTRRLCGRCSYLIWLPTWSTARCKIQISEVLQCVRLENGAPTRTMAPPAGGDPTHTPHKTRLQCDFSSCNRPILVYDLVYASGGQCQGGYGGYRIQARPKIGHSKLSSLAEFTLQGWCHAGACP